MPNDNDNEMKQVSTKCSERVGDTSNFNMWGLPASVSLHGKFVAIGGGELSKCLKSLYESGVRNVKAIVDVPGHRLTVTGKIYKNYNKQRGYAYYFIYPYGAAQILLRELYFKHRGNVSPNAKTPMPIIVVTITPTEGA